MRTVVRTLIAACCVGCPLLAALAVPAHAADHHLTSRTDQAASRPPAIAIDSVSPDYAQPGATITVRGTFTNDTGSPLPNVDVQLETGNQFFQTRSGMQAYADGSGPATPTFPVGSAYSAHATLAAGATTAWSASFRASGAQYPQFGVYPLQAVAVDGTTGDTLATEPTLLPYWPGKRSAVPVNVSWIWPLMDQPQQTGCSQTLSSSSLASGFGASGRLGALLSSGLRWASQTQLTWAIDPAVLWDANVMTRPYKVGGNSACEDASRRPASADAAAWLATLRTGTAGEPMFVTPYADTDVSALAHHGLNSDLQAAYTLGESVASGILNRPFGKNNVGTGDGHTAWLPGGTADAGVLSALADDGGISTVVLGSGQTPANGVDDAVSRVATGAGTTMDALLADSELSQLLGSATAASAPGTQFTTEQDFLAQTAMIVAEEPFLQRALVVAPPRRWDPSAAEAGTLLSMTASAPWLHPVKLSSLASARPDAPRTLPARHVSAAELGGGYLDRVKSADTSLALYKSLLYQPSAATLDSLEAALAVTESSAWRGPDAQGGRLALVKFSDFLEDAERKVQIITGTKALLAGASGNTPVSVQNGLSDPVQVAVQALLPEGSKLSLAGSRQLITVPADKIRTVTLSVHSSSIGTSTMQLQLVTRDGSPLTWTSRSLSVQVTRYGRALLVLIAAALGVLVLTSVARWLRQWLNETRTGSGGTG